MSVASGPSVVSSGLVLDLDVASVQSYSPNIMPNPIDIFGWCSSGASNATLSRDTSVPPSPAKGIPLKMAITGNDPYLNTYASSTWNLAPASAGQTWTASCYVRASSPTTAGFFVFGANSSGAIIQYTPNQVAITTEWTRISLVQVFTDPAIAYVQMRCDGPDSGGTGINIWWDGLQLELGSTATQFNPKPNLNFVNKWYDISGNTNNMTVGGYPAYSTTNGFTFPGSEVTKYAILNPFNSMPTTTITIEQWVKTSAGGGIISYASTTSDNDFLMYDVTNIGLYIALTSVASGVSIATNTWKQLVRTSNRTTGAENLYVNGVLQYSTTLAAGTLITNGGSLVLAQEQDSVGGGFDPNQALAGNIPIFRIYNRVLSADEVAQNFNAIRGRFGV